MVDSGGAPVHLYFKLHGRGLKIRLLLKHAGINWSEEHPGEGNWKKWAELKEEFPDRGGLPWLI